MSWRPGQLESVDDDMAKSRISRAVRLKPFADREVPFASIEDVILKKMDFYKEGGSVKHIRDIKVF